ncbi:TonB-dependent receptor [Rhodanobacter sp. AS-Z3]|uniref:TonB-dependent receptor n=1 Tax=Rhodanobacter sp. AS-Z3 TaxID=3031330 RepID=UPI0024797EC0|nr:TonB-dependent receptor [Rhodanobacter sp. AS-Z3]WEN14103.1 TonB-dependent receptor [Rhodanobacter sp. AS-Z3]
MKSLEKKLLVSAIAVILSNGMVVGNSHAQSAAGGAEGQAASGASDTSEGQTSSAKATSGTSAIKLKPVMVTAQRVSEQAQDVPIAVSAISAATLDVKGFESIEDIAAFTPGFNMYQSFGRTLDRPIIRGMVNILGQANASFFIDGVYVEGDISGYDLSNVAQIEVLRGPQSALFGRATFSGAVNYITKLPGNKPEGGFSLQVGNKGQEQVRMNYSAPLSSAWSFAANAYVNKLGGLYHNSVSGKDDLGGQKTQSVGGSLYFHPNSSFDATLRVNYQHDDDQSPAYYRYGVANSNCFGTPTGTVYAYFAPIYTNGPNYCGEVKVPNTFAVNTPAFGLSGHDAGLRNNILRSNVELHYYFANNWTLTSTTAYNTLTNYLGIDQDYSGIRGFGGAFESFSSQPSHDFSEQLRLATDQSAPLRGQVGVYYYRQGQGNGYKGDLTGFDLAPGQPGNSLAPVPVAPLTPGATVENKAVFGMIEYQINDQWGASVAARWGKDTIGQAGLDSGYLQIGPNYTLFTRAYNDKANFSKLVPRVAVTYAPQPELHFYASLAEGNKPSGFNQAVQSAALTDASRASLIAQGLSTFKESTSWTTELGVKSMWLEDRLRVNADIFNINWRNQTQTISVPNQTQDGKVGANSYTANIGSSRIRGLEVESEFLLSRDWLLNLSYTYLDAKVVNNPDPNLLYTIGVGNAAGQYLPAVPKNDVALGATYNHTLSNGWTLFGNADMFYQSSRFGTTSNINWTGASTKFNFRIGIEPRKGLRITAYVNNAFNNRTTENILGYIDPSQLIAYPNRQTGSGYKVGYPSDVAVTAPMPRLFGIRLDYRF